MVAPAETRRQNPAYVAVRFFGSKRYENRIAHNRFGSGRGGTRPDRSRVQPNRPGAHVRRAVPDGAAAGRQPGGRASDGRGARGVSERHQARLLRAAVPGALRAPAPGAGDRTLAHDARQSAGALCARGERDPAREYDPYRRPPPHAGLLLHAGPHVGPPRDCADRCFQGRRAVPLRCLPDPAQTVPRGVQRLRPRGARRAGGMPRIPQVVHDGGLHEGDRLRGASRPTEGIRPALRPHEGAVRPRT